MSFSLPSLFFFLHSPIVPFKVQSALSLRTTAQSQFCSGPQRSACGNKVTGKKKKEEKKHICFFFFNGERKRYTFCSSSLVFFFPHLNFFFFLCACLFQLLETQDRRESCRKWKKEFLSKKKKRAFHKVLFFSLFLQLKIALFFLSLALFSNAK